MELQVTIVIRILFKTNPASRSRWTGDLLLSLSCSDMLPCSLSLIFYQSLCLCLYLPVYLSLSLALNPLSLSFSYYSMKRLFMGCSKAYKIYKVDVQRIRNYSKGSILFQKCKSFVSLNFIHLNLCLFLVFIVQNFKASVKRKLDYDHCVKLSTENNFLIQHCLACLTLSTITNSIVLTQHYLVFRVIEKVWRFVGTHFGAFEK